MKYPKINTLWKRDEANNFSIVEGEYSCQEFESIEKWHVTEKIDGTNIRIHYSNKVPPGQEPIFEVKGRTDKSDIPLFLLEKLKDMFTTELLRKSFDLDQPIEVILFGEGYGNKIQSVGNKYRKDNNFILFDIWVNGWWFIREDVESVAKTLGLDIVPGLGIRRKDEIISLVKGTFPSSVSKQKLKAEGIVARSEPLMLFRNGEPIMFKLKCKDYEKLKTNKK